jgi:hypothetical protein
MRSSLAADGSHAGSHTDEQPSDAPYSAEQPKKTSRRSRTVPNGTGRQYGHLRIKRSLPRGCPRCPRIPAKLGNMPTRRGHASRRSVPGVPVLSNSLSLCSAPKAAVTRGCVYPRSVLQPLFGVQWRAISGPLGAGTGGLSRLLKVGRVCCSRSINRTGSVNSQADSAGSIPVTRSHGKARSPHTDGPASRCFTARPAWGQAVGRSSRARTHRRAFASPARSGKK